MQRYILGRIVALGLVAGGVAVIVFVLLRAIPGSAAVMILGDDVTKELIEVLERQMGLDRPLPIQFVEWAGNLLRGDLGNSLFSHKPVLPEVLGRLPVTLCLSGGALVLALVLAIPIGIMSAIRRNSTIDLVVRVAAMIGLATPNFWFAILFVLAFSVHLPLFPSSGFVAPWEDPIGSLRYLVLPAISLGLPVAAVLMRVMRSSMLEVLGEDYIRTARAKGLTEWVVVYRHGLRNAFLNVLTMIGMQTGRLLGGSVVVETIFGWPGVGSMAYRAIARRDYPMAQGAVLLSAFVYSAVTLLVDILYTYVDPRIRYE